MNSTQSKELSAKQLLKALMSGITIEEKKVHNPERLLNLLKKCLEAGAIETGLDPGAVGELFRNTRKEMKEMKNRKLLYAAKHNETDSITRMLRKGANIEYKDDDGMNALLYAIKADNLNIVQTLLLSGADPNATNKKEEACLVLAINQSKPEITIALLDAGANPNCSMFVCYTPGCKSDGGYEENAFHLALGRYNDELITALLQKDVDPNTQNHLGLHALTTAAIDGRKKHLLALLDKGADVNIREAEEGIRPLHCAVTKTLGDEEFCNPDYFTSVEVTKILLEKGAEVNAQDTSGRTALYLAAQKGNTEVCQVLLEHNADPNIDYPLYEALRHNHEETAILLLEHGANHNAKIFKYTAAETAVRLQLLRVCQWLYRVGTALT